MPAEILNQIAYHDRTVQDWHRERFPNNNWAIDLDLLGACCRCRQPLYLIEASTNPNKPTTILRCLARQADLPAFLIIHDNATITGGYQLWPTTTRLSDEEQTAAALAAVRADHLANQCRRRVAA